MPNAADVPEMNPGSGIGMLKAEPLCLNLVTWLYLINLRVQNISGLFEKADGIKYNMALARGLLQGKK